MVSIHLNPILCLPQTRAISNQKIIERKKLKPYFTQWPLHLYDGTRAMDIMFDEKVLSDSIAAEHHTINHKLDLCFVVVPFVTSSEKFHTSLIWKIVYFVYCVRYIVVSSYGDAHWSRSHSYQSFTICSNNDMTHRPCNQNVKRLRMWTVNRQPGTMGLRKSFSKDVSHIVEHETNQILLMYANFKSHFICDIRYCVWDDSFLFIDYHHFNATKFGLRVQSTPK